MIRADLDDTARDILLTTLASPKTSGELARILNLPGAMIMDYLELLERAGLVHVVLWYWASEGRVVRYYEASLPVDISDLVREEPAAI